MKYNDHVDKTCIKLEMVKVKGVHYVAYNVRS